ncbi:hypothetical protein PMAYCL1PPCAC_21486, partial [Pristionchus mayeri]
YIAATVGMTASSALQLLSVTVISSPEVLIAGRAVMALFSPLSEAALMMYLQESSPTHLRGTLSSLFSTGFVIMCMLGMQLGCLLDQSLPILISIPIPVGILSVAFLFFLPETPKYLLTKDDKEGALRSLSFFQGKQIDNKDTFEGKTTIEDDEG